MGASMYEKTARPSNHDKDRTNRLRAACAADKLEEDVEEV
jgi:hypothetical protein